MKLFELNQYLQKILNPNGLNFSDHRANGLQVSGKEDIQRIAFGVDATLEFMKQAYERKADVLIVHHGLSFEGIKNSLPDEILQNRLKFLFMTETSLFGFHFLLDHDPDVGNNAQILKKIGQGAEFPFGFDGSQNWGWGAKFDTPQSLEVLLNSFNRLFLNNAKMFNFGKENISSVGVVSGSGTEAIFEAKEKKIDLVIVGDIKEQTQEICRELEMNLIWGGHYITETFGVKALSEKVNIDLELETKFIDVPNLV